MKSQYVFLPWLRRGLAIDIDGIDPLAEAPYAQARAHMQFDLEVLGDDQVRDVVGQPVDLYGPGDITGIDRRAIVKTEPAAGVLTFEPNFFPYIEFYEEDFLWRYTPAAANGQRLRPWLALLTLEEHEFQLISARNAQGNPVIAVRGGADSPLLPPPDQGWLWAHVQINDGNLPAVDLGPSEQDQKIGESLSQNPNLGVSRLLCPRKLKPGTRYMAFLIPAFEKGRLAGLGAARDRIKEAGLFHPAWGADQTFQDGHFPVYYQWEFRTGADDFESLAEKIESQNLAGTEVGKIWMDVRSPGYGTSLGYQGNLDPDRPERQGFLPFEGALRLPLPEGAISPNLIRQTGDKEKQWVRAMADLLHLGLDYRATGQTDWQQIGALVFSGEADDPLVVPPVYGLHYLAPAQDFRLEPANIGHWPEELNLDPALRAAAGLGAEVVRRHQEGLMERAWEQFAHRQALNRQLQGLRLAQEVAKATFNKHFAGASETGSEVAVNRQLALTHSLHGAVGIEDKLSVAGKMVGYQADAAFVRPVYRRFTRSRGPVFRRITAVAKQINTLSVVMSGTVQFSTVAFFILTDPPFQNFSAEEMRKADGAKFIFQPGLWPNVVMPLETPNWYGNAPFRIFMVGREAMKNYFNDKLKNGVLRKPTLLKAPTPDIRAWSLKVREKINPALSFQLKFEVLLPSGGGATPPKEQISPHTFNPVFLEPTYEYLRDLQPELFIPNLDQLRPDSFSLLQANQAFIEAFLVGLNHEMAGELLWRGFPADMNATFFRQFWDAADNADLPANADRSDIKPIRTWGGASALGANLPAGGVASPLVFVIKADLVRRYPNLLVYAQRAKRVANGRKPANEVKAPLFLATMDPDFLFAGFDLSQEDVLDSTKSEGQRAGWYFVLAERPGELHFGLDLPDDTGATARWNDLNWADLPPDTDVLDVNTAIPPNPVRENLAWGKGTGASPADPASGNGDSAQMAAILQQRPVRVFVHASQLLG
ncbi:MAG: hypothetical protein NW241_15500 [Bacteroidia bacterium]|nr:hypothetical protein [Bacteroidia bacterium]